MPKVSVIVPTYNRKEYLSETILSILNQTFQDFELIIVDNFSNYDFFTHVKSFKSEKIIPLQNRNNGIIAINRNFGIKHAKGEYIAFCDDDDLWFENKLEVQINWLENNQKTLLICSDYFLLQRNFIYPVKSLKKYLIPIIGENNCICFMNFVANSSVVIRKDFFCDGNFINESDEVKTAEDYDLWLRASFHGRIKFLNKKTFKYRIHENQSSNSLVQTRKFLFIIRMHKNEVGSLKRLLFITRLLLFKVFNL
jgi:glycosyltransferase involved in cell wall biosynthesis